MQLKLCIYNQCGMYRKGIPNDLKSQWYYCSNMKKYLAKKDLKDKQLSCLLDEYFIGLLSLWAA